MQGIYGESAIFLLWILAPLVPSILLYKIFPDNKITADGPLAGLTVRASGAFAGYLIIFAATAYPGHEILQKAEEQEAANANGYWHIKVPVALADKTINESEASTLYQTAHVDYSPSQFRFGQKNIVDVWVRRSQDDGFPKLTIGLNSVPLQMSGSGDIYLPDDLSQIPDKNIDYTNHTITLTTPVNIITHKGVSF